MELMETDDPVKSRLLKETSQYRDDLEDEAKARGYKDEDIQNFKKSYENNYEFILVK